jgi:hypothetical protein
VCVSSLTRRTETCVGGEVKGEPGHKWGPSRLRFDILGLAFSPDLGAYPDSGAQEFGFSTLWLVNTPEIGDTTCAFYDPNMLSASMGARGCDGKRR